MGLRFSCNDSLLCLSTVDQATSNVVLYFWEADATEKGSLGPNTVVNSNLLALYIAVMSFEILFPFGLLVFEPDWLPNHSQLV